jgi:hypothetical protein
MLSLILLFNKSRLVGKNLNKFCGGLFYLRREMNDRCCEDHKGLWRGLSFYFSTLRIFGHLCFFFFFFFL